MVITELPAAILISLVLPESPEKKTIRFNFVWNGLLHGQTYEDVRLMRSLLVRRKETISNTVRVWKQETGQGSQHLAYVGHSLQCRNGRIPRSLRYLIGGTLSPFPAEAGHADDGLPGHNRIVPELATTHLLKLYVKLASDGDGSGRLSVGISSHRGLVTKRDYRVRCIALARRMRYFYYGSRVSLGGHGLASATPHHFYLPCDIRTLTTAHFLYETRTFQAGPTERSAFFVTAWGRTVCSEIVKHQDRC
jgi:hypothetical protein